MEYNDPKNIPEVPRKLTNQFWLKLPINIKSSPTKLLVPGNPKLLKGKNKKTKEKIGITKVNPL